MAVKNGQGAAPGIVWDRGRGATLIDAEGKEYIDFSSGVLVTNAGHSHPHITRAIQQQAEALMNCYEAPHSRKEEAKQAIIDLLPAELDEVFLLTTGSEAIESAVKLARSYTGRTEVIAFHGAFHGRTTLGMALAGNNEVRDAAGPAIPGVVHVPFPYCYRCPYGCQDPETCVLRDPSYIDWYIKTAAKGDVAAIIVEPYQGAGGCIVPPKGFLSKLAQFAKERDIVLIMDEIQSGFGRTGSMFAFEQENFVPDIVCMAKGLANGFPASAVATRREIADALPAGAISSTYGGNPLACAAIIATIEVMKEENLPARANELAGPFARGLQRLMEFAPVGDVRSWGLVGGIEFVKDRETKEPDQEFARRVANECQARGLALIQPTGLFGNVVRVMPPLVISEEEMERGFDILCEAIQALSE